MALWKPVDEFIYCEFLFLFIFYIIFLCILLIYSFKKYYIYTINN